MNTASVVVTCEMVGTLNHIKLFNYLWLNTARARDRARASTISSASARSRARARARGSTRLIGAKR